MSLAHPEVIARLNRFFVPVFTANEDYRETGGAPASDKALLSRIRKQAQTMGLSMGSVHAYILAPDGRVLDSLHVVEAAKPARLLSMLDGATTQLNTAPGEAVLQFKATPPPCPPDRLRLQIVARYLRRDGAGYQLIQSEGGSWDALPAEDWLVLSAAQRQQFLPTGTPRPDLEWTIPSALSETILTRFYPPTENNNLATNRLLQSTLTARVQSVRDGVAQARLSGLLHMKHAFYPGRDDTRHVRANLTGHLEWDVRTKAIRTLEIVTDNAVYSAEPPAANTRAQDFGVALRLSPEIKK